MTEDGIEACNFAHPPSAQVLKNSGLTWKTIVAYGLGHVLNDLTASIWFFYAVLYAQQVLQLSQKATGLLMLVGQIVDGLATPIVGYGSDRTNSWYGKRKPWHLFGVICVAFTFPLVFGGCQIGGTPSNFLHGLCVLEPWKMTKLNIGLLVTFIAFFQIGWASSQVSHLALIPDLTKNDRERTLLNAVRYGVTVGCNIFVLVILWILLDLRVHKVESGSCNLQLERSDQMTFQYLSWLVTIIGGISAIGFHSGVENHPEAEEEPLSMASDALFDSFKDMKDWNFFNELMFWKTGLLYMLSRLIINLNMVYLPLYVQNTMVMGRTSIAIIPLLMYIFSLLGSTVQHKLNSKFGRVIAFTVGVMLQMIASLGIFFLPKRMSYLLYGIAPCIGLAGTTLLVTVCSMTSDLIGKRTCSAKIFGLYSFSDKMSCGIVIYIIQAMMKCKDCCIDMDCCGKFYRNVLGLIPLCAAATSILVILLLNQRKKDSKLSEKTPLLQD